MKNVPVESYSVSVTFNLPLKFVFEWCTDFREDDGKMTGSKAKRQFLEHSKKRIVWVVYYKENGKSKEGVRVVWLEPPNSWHLDTCGDHREIGDYTLVSLGKNKTRLDMAFQFAYEDPKQVEGKEKWERETLELWETYSKYLEKDYKASLK